MAILALSMRYKVFLAYMGWMISPVMLVFAKILSNTKFNKGNEEHRFVIEERMV